MKQQIDLFKNMYDIDINKLIVIPNDNYEPGYDGGYKILYDYESDRVFSLWCSPQTFGIPITIGYYNGYIAEDDSLKKCVIEKIRKLYKRPKEIDIYNLKNVINILINYLAINMDKLYSLTDIYNELKKNREEYNFKLAENLKILKTAFYILDEKNKNIHKLKIHDKYYIIFSKKSRFELLDLYQFKKIEINKDMYEVKINYIEIIEILIYNRLYDKIINKNIYLDGNNTGLHLLVKDKNVKLLTIISQNLLSENKCIDWTIKNSLGETCLDIANKEYNVTMINYIYKNETKILEKEYDLKNNSYEQLKNISNVIKFWFKFYFVLTILLLLSISIVSYRKESYIISISSLIILLLNIYICKLIKKNKLNQLNQLQ